MTFIAERPKVSIIIPVLYLQRPLNKKRFFMPRYTVREVLRDIAENVRIAHEVVVICNGREDDLIDLVKTNPVITKYCLNNMNAGVARSWNIGAQLAEGEMLLFLNDDVSVGVGGVERLDEVLRSAPDIGIVGPVGANWKGAEHDYFVECDDVAEAHMIAGNCFMLRSETFHSLGGFDVNYTPAGFEEIDFCNAARKNGLRNLAVSGAVFHHYHHHGISAYKQGIRYFNNIIDTEDLHARNKAYFMKKWDIPA